MIQGGRQRWGENCSCKMASGWGCENLWMVEGCPPPRILQNALWPWRHPHPTQEEGSSSVLFGHTSPAWQPPWPHPGIFVSGPWPTWPRFPVWAYLAPGTDPHMGDGAGAPWGGVSWLRLQREGSGDLMAAPIPFFFHESCF